MSRTDKWLKTIPQNALAVPWATRITRHRLRGFWRELIHAFRDSDKLNVSSTGIHAIRVAARRAATAIHIFDRVLPESVPSWFLKRVKRVRRAAGKVRDIDLVHARTSETLPTDLAACPDALFQLISKSRRKEVKKLHRILLELEQQRFKSRIKSRLRITSTTQHVGELTWNTLAVQAMQHQVDHFLHSAQTDGTDLQAFHDLRIDGKQFRYGLEFFPTEFEDAARSAALAALTDLHERLGLLNDSLTITRTLKEFLEKSDEREVRAMLQRMLQEEQTTLNRRSQEAQRWWQDSAISEFPPICAKLLSGSVSQQSVGQ